MIRLAIADDQAVVRLGLRVMLEADADITVVGEAAQGQEAVDLVRRTRPDVVLMDVRMPVMEGFEALRVIRDDVRLNDTRIIMLTAFDLDEYLAEAQRAGANGFLVKHVSPTELRNTVRALARGRRHLWVPPP